MDGRKPLPTTVKKIRGTLQKCRTNLNEPKPQGELVDPLRIPVIVTADSGLS